MKRFLATLLVSGALTAGLLTGAHAQQSYPQDQQQINTPGPMNNGSQFDNGQMNNNGSQLDNSGPMNNGQMNTNGSQIDNGSQMNTNGSQGAQGYPKVSDLTPFSAQANYMSLPGYLRFLVYQRDGVWMDRQQAAAIVDSQIATGE